MTILDRLIERVRKDKEGIVLLQKFLLACSDYVRAAGIANSYERFNISPLPDDDLTKSVRNLHNAYALIRPYRLDLPSGQPEEIAFRLAIAIFEERKR